MIAKQIKRSADLNALCLEFIIQGYFPGSNSWEINCDSKYKTKLHKESTDICRRLKKSDNWIRLSIFPQLCEMISSTAHTYWKLRRCLMEGEYSIRARQHRLHSASPATIFPLCSNIPRRSVTALDFYLALSGSSHTPPPPRPPHLPVLFLSLWRLDCLTCWLQPFSHNEWVSLAEASE